MLKKKKIIIVGGGIITYITSTLLFYQWKKNKNINENEKKGNEIIPLNNKKENYQIFDKISENYDEKINKDEFFMGLLLIRKFLLKNAKGNVCEVNCGTGRNLQYYNNKKCFSLTLIDQSFSMIEQAKKKVQYLWNKNKNSFLNPQNIHFLVMNIQYLTNDNKQNLLINHKNQETFLEKNSFDTVISTFGLCSCDNPVQMLKEIQKICKEDGIILLLEHGRTKKKFFQWINNILDKNVVQHSNKWGCWWNRDIDEILKLSNIQIIKLRKFHFGTTYYIIAKPNKHLN